MAYEGMLANALVTALAAAGFLYVVLEVRRRRVPTEKRALAAVLFFGIIGVHLAGAALRQVVAYAATSNPALQAVEEAVFYVVVVPATLSIVPLGYIAAWALTGRERLTQAVAGTLLIVCALGIGAVFIEGIVGPDVSYWASEWAIESRVARAALGVITLTAFAAGAILLRGGRGAPSDAGRRAKLIGWSCIIYYAAFLGDALGEPGIMLLIERIVMLVAATIGYRAYFGGTIAAPGPSRVTP